MLWKKRAALVALLSFGLLSSALVDAPGGAAGAGQAVDPFGSLVDVSVRTPTDAWAVGATYGQNDSSTLIEHWDGSTWTRVSSPNAGQGAELAGVDALAADDAWAVGDYFDPDSGTYAVLIGHWDGTSWERVPTPRVNAMLTSVSASSATDVWAAGHGANGIALLHWDGTSWSKAANPSYFGIHVIRGLRGITAISPTDAWAVGYTGGRISRPMTMHWDGVRWRIVPSALPRAVNGELESVSATASDDVWSVGFYTTPAFTFRSFVQHWDGTIWTRVASLNRQGRDGSILYGVLALSPADAWSVGYRRRPNRTVTDHWDGDRWCHVRSPNPGLLFDVDGTSPSDVWAVGSRGRQQLIEHWDGLAWSVF